MPTWTADQERALAAFAEWWRAPDRPFFYLAGYAGTGKTTLAQHLVQHVEGDVLFGAYTGKAANVLRGRGFPDARTLHSLAYKPKGKSENRYKEIQAELAEASDPERRQELEAELQEENNRLHRPSFELNMEDSPLLNAALLGIDEGSMVDERMAKDLLQFGVPILVLGDPGQLKPVAGSGYFVRHEPDVTLTEVQRHAGPILRAATAVREGREVPKGVWSSDESTLRKVSKRDLSRTELAEAVHAGAQLITGKNATRRRLNGQVRRHAGRASWLPEEGERMVCLRNNNEIGLLNGLLGETIEAGRASDDDPESVYLSLRLEGADKYGLDCLAAHLEPYATHPPSDPRTVPYFVKLNREEFDYGYALTVHKAQGSQWPEVWLCDDGFLKWDRADRQRWLYTALTRAEEKLVWLV